MRAAALVLLVVLVAACGDGEETVQPSPTTIRDRTVAVLEAEVERLEHELVRSNADQLDLREKVRQLYVERASRSAPRRRTATAARTTEVRAVGGDVWARLAMCESGGRNANTGNGFYGYLQFDLRTWRGLGMSGYPHEHSWDVQLAAAKRLHAQRGWAPWPACARKLGLR